jgi:phosphoglucomutase
MSLFTSDRDIGPLCNGYRLPRQNRLRSRCIYAIFKLMSEIKFGTDGWQARMGKDFTFDRVRLTAQAFANLSKRTHGSKESAVMINYDTRYLSETFAKKAAQILSLNKIHVIFPLRDAPTPAMALAIVQKQMRGGMCFTATLNEPIYNGIKIFSANGAPAMPSKTLLLENEINKIEANFRFKHQYPDSSLIHHLDIRAPYLDHIASIIRLDTIKRARLKIIVDSLYGTSRDYLDRLLSDHGIEITAIHNYSDSYFGGGIPSCNQSNLRELARLVVSKGADIGLASDIGSDRFGIIDCRGRFVDANQIMPPLIEYLITVRKMNGDIIKSISSTEQITRVANHYQRKVHETPVGFKFLADMLSSRSAFIGVESTNGAALNGIIPCRDGILFNLLISEMLAHSQLSLPLLLNNFAKRFPPLFNREIGMIKNTARHEKYLALLQEKKFHFPGLDLLKIKYIDGIKFVFKDSWLLLRESGTNNVIRICAESSTPKQAQQLVHSGRKLLE